MSLESELMIGLGCAVLGYLATLEIRLRDVQGQLLRSKETVIDEKINQKVAALSPTALDAALKDDLGGNGD